MGGNNWANIKQLKQSNDLASQWQSLFFFFFLFKPSTVPLGRSRSCKRWIILLPSSVYFSSHYWEEIPAKMSDHFRFTVLMISTVRSSHLSLWEVYSQEKLSNTQKKYCFIIHQSTDITKLIKCLLSSNWTQDWRVIIQCQASDR